MKASRHSKVEIAGDTVTKKASPDLLRIEVEKTLRAREIGTKSGLFTVPKILEFNEEKGVVILERIRGIEPLWKSVFTMPRRQEMMSRIGRSLATIHRELALPQEMVHALPEELAHSDLQAFLHGDFNAVNLNIRNSNSEIVILDWQMTSRHDGKATYGTAYFDLLWFANYMLWVPTLRHLYSRPVIPVVTPFFESYFREANFPYSAQAISRYAECFFRAKAPYRKAHASWRNRCVLWRSEMLTRNFVESLSRMQVNA